jgi:hypothetical protein
MTHARNQGEPLLTDLPTIEPEHEARGGDPSMVGDELLWRIGETIGAHPRSQQRRIGPSEIGTPCARKLGLKLSGERGRERRAWRPTVGTAVHTWLADAFMAANTAAGFTRYLVETTVEVGDVDGTVITGSADLYDRVTATVVDWKIVGRTTLLAARRSGPKDTYRTQVQLYGNGFRRRGVPVDTVAVMYLPSAGELSDAVYCPMPFDPVIAHQALVRVDAIAAAVRMGGAPLIVPQLSTAPDYCTHCGYFTPGTTDLARQCPGDPSETAARTANASRQLEGLVTR